MHYCDCKGTTKLQLLQRVFLRMLTKLLRLDVLNKYAIAIGYNMEPIVPGKGSAIFMHVQRHSNHKTAGCISMPEQKIKDLIKWLDPQKDPYIYISKRID